MTNRPISEDDLQAFVDEALDPARRLEVSAYLVAHPEAAARIGAWREERKLLREALAPIAEEPLPPELDLRRMAARAKRPPSAGLRRTAAFATAAAALVLLGGWGGWTLRGLERASMAGLMALGRDAAASYAVYAPDQIRPLELRAEDRGGLAVWAAEGPGGPVAIPDLSASGYRFLGGRALTTVHGPAALLMYDGAAGNRLVMLARSMPDSEATSMRPLLLGEVGGFIWSEGGFGYSLVGEGPPEALHPLANEARRQIRSGV